MLKPFEKTWWIQKSRLMGGQYPGAPDAPTMQAKLEGLVELGIDTFINLQEADETGHGTSPFPDYMPWFNKLRIKSGHPAAFDRFPIPDGSTPAEGLMDKILDHIDQRLAEGRTIYLHCWGGNGRTGTVAGCWLIRHGLTAEEALAEMKSARAGRRFVNEAPENSRQVSFVHAWPT